MINPIRIYNGHLSQEIKIRFDFIRPALPSTEKWTKSV